MIGRLIEIHPNDPFYTDRELLIGSLWRIDRMWEWDGSQYTQEITGYMAGDAILLDPDLITFLPSKETIRPLERTLFHAVKFEIVEESGE